MSYYAHVLDMPGSVEFYDAIHAEMLRRTEGDVDGLLVHVTRSTPTGFQVIEVWTDRDSCERAERDIVGPIIAGLAGPSAATLDAAAAHVEEFVPRGLVVPGGRAVL